MRYVVAKNDELYHFGVKGMKWGVRRYRNYDGTRTKKGVKRFDEAASKYDEVDAKYRSAKSSYKNNQLSKEEYAAIKRERSDAKRAVKTQYKKLKQDKLYDQGKELYKNNKRITNNNQVESFMIFGTALATKILHESGDDDMAKKAFIGGAIATLGHHIVSEYQNRRLRVFYAGSTPQAKTSGNLSKPKSDQKKKTPKYTQDQAIKKGYTDLEKKYPNFNELPYDVQDQMWMDYMNESGLYRYI